MIAELRLRYRFDQFDVCTCVCVCGACLGVCVGVGVVYQYVYVHVVVEGGEAKIKEHDMKCIKILNGSAKGKGTGSKVSYKGTKRESNKYSKLM